MNQEPDKLFNRKPYRFAGILFSGACWFLSCGLNGDYWWLLWVAPVPILLMSWEYSAGKSFMVAFIAALIGRLSWVTYLFSVVPVPLALLFTLLLPLIFALIVLTARRIVLVRQDGLSVLAYPVLLTSYEWLFSLVSRDGTIASIAYSQMNFLPIIQVVSLTGIYGITFVVSLVASGMALMIYFRKDRRRRNVVALISLGVLLPVIVGGFWRISGKKDAPTIKIGMGALDESIYRTHSNADSSLDLRIASGYARQITQLSKQGCKLVMIPEKAMDLTDTSIRNVLTSACRENTIALIAGATLVKDGKKLNMALAYDEAGNTIAEYQKVNLFEGEVYEGYVPGKLRGHLQLGGINAALVICKDMDFQRYIRSYSQDSIRICYVPAWDFDRDGWLHSRMAVLRGVENGYAVVRNARSGRLTISDRTGKILQEAIADKGNEVMLTGDSPLYLSNSFYARTGEWFGIIMLLSSLYFIKAFWKKSV